MTITDGAACPSCGGLQMVGHPAGLLAWRHTMTCLLRTHEDARHIADLDLLTWGTYHWRAATATEQTLLTAAGHDLDPSAALVTALHRLTTGVIQRAWPALTPVTDTGGATS